MIRQATGAFKVERFMITCAFVVHLSFSPFVADVAGVLSVKNLADETVSDGYRRPHEQEKKSTVSPNERLGS